MHHLRRRAHLIAAVALAGAAVAAPTAVAQTTDECAALNGVRYAAPEDATTAQYVGVAGACNAAEDPDAEVAVVPVGGRRSGGGGGAAPAPADSGGSPAIPAPGPGGETTTEQGTTPPPVPAPNRTPKRRAATTPADASAEVAVAQALSSTDDTRPTFVSAGALVSPDVGLPLLAGLLLVGGAVGLRKRLN